MHIRQIAKDAQTRAIEDLEDGPSSPLAVGLAKGEAALQREFVPLVREAKANAEDMDFEEDLDEAELREMIVDNVATAMQLRVLQAELDHAETNA